MASAAKGWKCVDEISSSVAVLVARYRNSQSRTMMLKQAKVASSTVRQPCPIGPLSLRRTGCVSKAMQHTVAKARSNRLPRSTKMTVRASAAGASTPVSASAAAAPVKSEGSSTPVFLSGEYNRLHRASRIASLVTQNPNHHLVLTTNPHPTKQVPMAQSASACSSSCSQPDTRLLLVSARHSTPEAEMRAVTILCEAHRSQSLRMHL